MATTRNPKHTSPQKTPRPRCHHCGQYLPQERRERLTDGLVRALRQIAAEGGQHNFIEVDPYKFKGTHGKLRYWDLLEEQMYISEDDPDHPQRRSGRWRLTQRGRDYLAGKIQVPEYAVVLQDQVVRYEGAGKEPEILEDHGLDADLLAALLE